MLNHNPTLFVRRDEVEAAWTWIDSIEAGWKSHDIKPAPYPAGSWGPGQRPSRSPNATATAGTIEALLPGSPGVEVDGVVATMSITGYAAELLRGYAASEWAPVGETVARGEVLAVVDAVKVACEIPSPVRRGAGCGSDDGAAGDVDRRSWMSCSARCSTRC